MKSTYKCGEGVTGIFDWDTKVMELYSDNGTLDPYWPIEENDDEEDDDGPGCYIREEICSVKVNGTIRLPKDSSGIYDHRMFRNMYSLKSIDTRAFDASGVTDMTGMFTNCYALQTLDLNSWDTSKVKSMWGMFMNCHSLTDIQIRIQTPLVNDMGSMFNGCHKLTSLDLSSFDTSSVKDMSPDGAGPEWI